MSERWQIIRIRPDGDEAIMDTYESLEAAEQELSLYQKSPPPGFTYEIREMTCRECKSLEEEVRRLEKKVTDLTEDLQDARLEANNEIEAVRDEMTAAETARALIAADLLNTLLTLVDGMIAGTERHADLELPRLRRAVENWLP